MLKRRVISEISVKKRIMSWFVNDHEIEIVNLQEKEFVHTTSAWEIQLDFPFLQTESSLILVSFGTKISFLRLIKNANFEKKRYLLESWKKRIITAEMSKLGILFSPIMCKRMLQRDLP